MAIDMESSIDSLSELDLWTKLREGFPLTLADVPELIRLRWNYFRDNWGKIKSNYIELIPSYDNPDKLKQEINTFTEFVDSQRNSKNNKNPFDNKNIIYKFYTIFDNTRIDSINTTFEETVIIQNKVDHVQNFTRKDFLDIRQDLQSERDAIADRVSLSDTDYNRVFNRSSQASRVNVRNKDINNMYYLMQAIGLVDYILANYFSLENATVDPFALAKFNANNPEIDIATYASGTLSKINYGEDLQSFARRTMGSPDRWIDIAIANGLKPPYIDEVGQKIMLIANGSGNQINIAGSIAGVPIINKFYTGQSITLQSATQTFPEQRTIINFRQIPVSDDIVIELDGSRDLERYRTSEGANIRVYKPSTANSSVFILVPSTEALPDDIKNETPWFLKSSSETEKRQKIDLSINDSGDLIFNSNSDLQLVYGIENSIQAVKMKMSVERGELRRHTVLAL